MSDILFEEKEDKVKEYFEKVINGYLVNDIKTLLDPALDEKKEGGCSAPLAMTVFSAMNELGRLTSGKNSKEIIEGVNTENCIKEFCNDWMKKVNEKYKKSSIQELLVSLFRHGLAHQFLPIALSAITRNPNQKELICRREIDKGEFIYVLQVKILSQDFLKALEFLEIKIDTAKEKDPEFISRFYERLCIKQEKQIKKNEDLIQKADKNLVLDASEIADVTPSGIKTRDISGEVRMSRDSFLK
jgi:hypothetical protein